jgi:ankyrin repeat protein
MPLTIGHCLEYAIYHSPLRFIRTLLEIGADPTPPDHSGFPPLLAALSKSRSRPGSPARPDIVEIIELLLSLGADPNQRGVNGYTALHMAVAERNLKAVEVLLQGGADLGCRTGIDDDETARELAVKAGLPDFVKLLDSWEAGSEGG